MANLERDLLELADGTVEAQQTSQPPIKPVQAAGGLFADLAPQSVPFGSPHASSPAPPTSPLDTTAKLLDFEGTKPTTPAPAASPPTPTLSPAPAATPAAPAASNTSTITAAPGAGGFAPSASSSVPATPLGVGAGTSSTGDSGLVVDYDAFVKDTLLWVNKVRSAVYLVGGLFAIYVLHRLLTSNVTLVTGVCWVLLAQSGLNFVRGFINPKLQARCTWQDSAFTSFFINSYSTAVQAAAALHDKHLVNADASKLLRVLVVLWAVSLAGRTAGVTSLAASLWVLAFALPKAYLTYQTKVDKVVSDALNEVKGHFVKLDTRVRAAVIIIPTFVAGYLLSRVDLAIALFAVALYGRSCIGQAQVDKINNTLGPAINNTVNKVGEIGRAHV